MKERKRRCRKSRLVPKCHNSITAGLMAGLRCEERARMTLGSFPHHHRCSSWDDRNLIPTTCLRLLISLFPPRLKITVKVKWANEGGGKRTSEHISFHLFTKGPRWRREKIGTAVGVMIAILFLLIIVSRDSTINASAYDMKVIKWVSEILINYSWTTHHTHERWWRWLRVVWPCCVNVHRLSD